MYEPRKIPFSIEIKQPSSPGSLIFNTTCVQNYKCVHLCVIAAEQLKKQNVQEDSRQAKRTLLQTLDLISSWKSEEYKFYISDNAKDQQIFNFDNVPSDQKEVMEQIRTKCSSLTPVGVYMEVENIDKLRENDIFSMFTVLSMQTNGSFDIQESFIETLSGIIYPISTIFESGVHQDTEELLNQHQQQFDSNTRQLNNVTSIYQQNCVVCHTHPVTRTNMPCKHACVCKICFQKLDNVCPICRQPISSFLVLRDESFLPRSEQEEEQDISSDIRRMGWWEFIKAVWNAG